jgi:hypothetical protein
MLWRSFQFDEVDGPFLKGEINEGKIVEVDKWKGSMWRFDTYVVLAEVNPLMISVSSDLFNT